MGRRTFTRLSVCALMAMIAGGVPGSATGAVVFSSDRCTDTEQRTQDPDCDFAIWRTEDDGTGLRRLTPTRGLPHHPSFAAGGSLVAFWRPNNAVAAADEGPSELWRVGSDGAGERRVATAFGLGVEDIVQPDASPVGREVVFSARNRFERGNRDLYVTSLDGSRARRLTNEPGTEELEPRVSPDGRTVAFYKGNGPTLVNDGSGIYSVPLSGGPVVPLVVGAPPGPDYGGYVHGFAWSPEGRGLAFASGRLIYSVTADGRDLRIAGDIASSSSELAWTGSSRPRLLVSDPDLPLPGDERRASPLFPNSEYVSGARPLYGVDPGSPGSSARPFTPLVAGRSAQESFSGDRGPDWSPERLLPLPGDFRPPAVELIDGADGRFAGRSRSRRRGRKGSVPARRLRFLAVDVNGVRRVEAAVGKRVGRRGRRQLCRFSTGRRATRRRRCSQPRFVRLRTPRSLSRLTRPLGRGAYEIRLRASDRRGNRSARPRALSLRVGR